MKKNITKKFNLNLASLWTQSNSMELCSGVVPTRIVVRMVESESVIGKKDKNPYNLGHFGLKDISLKVSGE